MIHLENNASAQTSHVGEVGTISSDSLSTAPLSQTDVNFEIPDVGEGKVSVLDFDELSYGPAEPEAADATSGLGDMSSMEPISATSNAPAPNGGTFGGTTGGEGSFAPTFAGGSLGTMGDVGATNLSANMSFDGGESGDLITGDENNSHGDGSEIGGDSANGIDGRMIYADDAVYEGPEVVTSEADLSIEEMLALDANTLKDLIGRMTTEQYQDFVKGVKQYYQNQIDNLDQLLDNMDPFYQEMYDLYSELINVDGWNEFKISIDSYISERIELLLQGFNSDILDAGGITLEEFRDYTYEEQLEFLKKYDPVVQNQMAGLEERLQELNEKVAAKFGDLGITTLDELKSKMDLLEATIADTKQSIVMLTNYRDSAEFDYLLFSRDFADYEMHTLTKEELQGIQDSLRVQGHSAYYDFASFHEKFPEVSPLDYVKEIRKPGSLVQIPIQGIPNLEAIMMAIQASPYLPNYEKTFQYLFAEDPSKAYAFLEQTEYQIRNIIGQLRAKDFLDKLAEKGENADFLAAIENELGVSLKGLIDGLDSFGDGVGYTFEAFVSLFTGEYNRQLSVDDYEKMYILYALMSTEAKQKQGLIVDNGDGTFSNNTDPNVNPYEIIDFSKDYCGLFLSNNYEISQGIGNMLPTIALSAVNPAAGMWALGVSAGGNSYHNAMVNNNSYYSSIVYGIFSGFSEAVTERLFGGIPFLSDVKVTSWKTLFQAMGREFTQESLQGVMDLFARRDFLGEALPDLSDIEGWKEIGLDLFKQGAYGAITAGLLQSPSFALYVYNLNSINQFMNQNNISTEDQQTALERLRAVNPEYANLSDSDIRVQYGQQLAAEAMIAKTARENNVSLDVAKVMLAFSVDADVASYMIEEHSTLEGALAALGGENPFDLFQYSSSGHILTPKLIRDSIGQLCNRSRSKLPDAIQQLITQFIEAPNGRVVPDLRMVCREGLNLLKLNNFSNPEEMIGEMMREAMNDFGMQTMVDPDTGIVIHLMNHMNWNNQVNRPADILEVLKQLPEELRGMIRELNFYDTFNPYDFYWEKEYQDQDFYSAATGGGGVVNFWAANQNYDARLLAHEIAHTLDRQWASKMGVKGSISDSSKWADAVNADFKTSGLMGVSEYARIAYNGNGTFAEDFADAVALYYSNPNALDQFPARKALLEQLLPKPATLTISSAYDQVYDILVNKYGEEEAKIRLKRYYETGRSDFITRDGGARKLIERFSLDEFREYIDQIEAQELQNKYQAIDLSWKLCLSSLIQKYGYKDAIAQLQAFIDSGSTSYITRNNGARDSIVYSIEDYRNYVRSINDGSLDLSNLY